MHLMEAPEHPCAVCGKLTRDGLFVPTLADEKYRPGAPAPLCHEHKAAFLRGDMKFPIWCPGCRAWRAAEHDHEAKAQRPRSAPPKR